MSTSSNLGFRSERGPILIALMLSTSLIALDSTILATAVPSIVADLGGLTQFPWLFSVYLLAQAVSVPVYAKLADTVGPQAGHPRRHRALPRRQHPLRVRLGHGLAHRHAGPAGARRRRGAAHDDDDRRRHLHRGRARQDPGLHRERLGRVVRRRPHARWRLLPVRLVALDLLRQHPVLPARRGHAVAQLRRVRRATPAPHRLRRGRRPHGRADAAHPRRPRGRPGLGVELVAEHRLLRRRRLCCSSSSASSSAARRSRCCRSRC